MHALEKNRSIFDDPELLLIVREKVKMLYENLRTPMWHFDDGWRHEVIYQIYFLGDEFEILQHITSNYEKWKFCIWHFPMFCESNRTVPNSTKKKVLITILLGAYSSLRLVVPQ